ncbi:MAG TPA: phosphonate C-P lyase system protein PhnH [Rhodopila sp.]|nr:phosphonate C-P lyase system protein PhnH [Rhodopila sp.]
MDSSTLSPGFAAPVIDAQVTFRALLDAMAHPGAAHAVAPLSPPAPLNQAAAAALLTLVDHETRVWIDPSAAAAAPWIAFHTGAPRVAEMAQCAFALALTLPDLAALPGGSDEAPEASATVILQVASLDGGRRYRLAGPGLRVPETIAVDGLPADFAALWRDNHRLFPRGVDLVLCSGDRLAALPRSVSIEEV